MLWFIVVDIVQILLLPILRLTCLEFPLHDVLILVGLVMIPILFVVIVYYERLLANQGRSRELGKQVDEEVITEIDEEVIPEIKETPTVKYSKSNLDHTKFDQLAVQLNNFMELQQPYLEMTFSVGDITDALDISAHDLSILINQRLSSSFYEYVNGYRIQYFLNNIDRINNNELTILALAFEAGFNSKSTFNKYFRKQIGCSPTDHIRNPVLKQEAVSDIY